MGFLFILNIFIIIYFIEVKKENYLLIIINNL